MKASLRIASLTVLTLFIADAHGQVFHAWPSSDHHRLQPAPDSWQDPQLGITRCTDCDFEEHAQQYRHGFLWANYCQEKQRCGPEFAYGGHWTPLRSLWQLILEPIAPACGCHDRTCPTCQQAQATSTHSLLGRFGRSGDRIDAKLLPHEPQPAHARPDSPAAPASSSPGQSPEPGASPQSLIPRRQDEPLREMAPLIVTPDQPVEEEPAVRHQQADEPAAPSTAPESSDLPQNFMPEPDETGSHLQPANAVPAAPVSMRLKEFIRTY